MAFLSFASDCCLFLFKAAIYIWWTIYIKSYLQAGCNNRLTLMISDDAESRSSTRMVWSDRRALWRKRSKNHFSCVRTGMGGAGRGEHLPVGHRPEILHCPDLWQLVSASGGLGQRRCCENSASSLVFWVLGIPTFLLPKHWWRCVTDITFVFFELEAPLILHHPVWQCTLHCGSYQLWPFLTKVKCQVMNIRWLSETPLIANQWNKNCSFFMWNKKEEITTSEVSGLYNQMYM